VSEELTKKRKHLEALDAFLVSPAHEGYKIAIQAEIEANKDAQVAITPDSIRDFVELCQQKGELRLLESELTRFEDARAVLGNRIDEMVEAELSSSSETKK
jgi:hypothetical protein